METTTTLPAINIAELQKVIGEAPTVLEENRLSVSKALAVGNNLLKLAKTDGMSDLMDSQMANFQAKVKVTIKTMNEKRKGFTQLVDKYKKDFTSLESALDPVDAEIQTLRDAHATKKINEQKERERVALLQKQKDIEKIEVKRQAEVKLSEKFQDILTAQKNGMLEQFEAYTLETIDSAEVGIKAISEAFTTESFNGLSVTITSSILTKEEVASIVADVKSRELFASFNEQFKQAVSAEKRTMIDKLPSKKQELKEIYDAEQLSVSEKTTLLGLPESFPINETTDVAVLDRNQSTITIAIGPLGNKIKATINLYDIPEETKRELLSWNLLDSNKITPSSLVLSKAEVMKAEAAIRKEEEAQKIIADQEAARKEAEAKASVTASSEAATAIVTAQATMTFDAPRVKESYKIEVTNNAAYLIIAQFWFENGGKTLSQEKIERKTFAQMKAFCEDYATKNDEKINSPFINYVETIKAK